MTDEYGREKGVSDRRERDGLNEIKYLIRYAPFHSALLWFRF